MFQRAWAAAARGGRGHRGGHKHAPLEPRFGPSEASDVAIVDVLYEENGAVTPLGTGAMDGLQESPDLKTMTSSHGAIKDSERLRTHRPSGVKSREQETGSDANMGGA